MWLGFEEQGEAWRNVLEQGRKEWCRKGTWYGGMEHVMRYKVCVLALYGRGDIELVDLCLYSLYCKCVYVYLCAEGEREREGTGL